MELELLDDLHILQRYCDQVQCMQHHGLPVAWESDAQSLHFTLANCDHVVTDTHLTGACQDSFSSMATFLLQLSTTNCACLVADHVLCCLAYADVRHKVASTAGIVGEDQCLCPQHKQWCFQSGWEVVRCGVAKSTPSPEPSGMSSSLWCFVLQCS